MNEALLREEVLARYIIDNRATIRQTAKVFSYSKSLVHNDVSNKLSKTNRNLFIEVHKILEKNFNEKHIRGGIATKNKYLKLYKNSAIKIIG